MYIPSSEVRSPHDSLIRSVLYHTSFKHTSPFLSTMTSASLSKGLWDPCRILDVHLDAPSFQCFAIAARTDARCRWTSDSERFSASQHVAALKSLLAMSEKHPAGITRAALHALAQSTMCELHQRQAADKSSEWKARIDRYVREHGELLERDAEIERLRRQLEGSKANLEESCSEIASLKAEAWEADKRIDERAKASEEEAKDLRQQLDASSREVADLLKAKMLSDYGAELSEVSMESMRQELRASNARHEALEATIKDSERKVEEGKDLRQQLDASSREVADLLGAKTSSDEKARLSEVEVESMRQELRASNARHEALEAKIKDSKRKLEALSQRYSASKNERMELQEHMEEVKQDLAKRDQHIEQLVEQKEGAERTSVERDQNVKQLVEQKDGMKQGLVERDQHIKQLEEQKEGVRQELAKRDQHIEQLVEQVKELKQEVAEREVCEP